MKRSNLILAALCVLVDAAAIFFALIWAYMLRADGTQLYFWSFSRYLTLALWTLPLWLVLFASQGLYNPRNLPRGWNAFGRSLVGLLSGWGAILIILYLWRAPEALVLPRLLIVYGILLTTGLVLVGKTLISLVIKIMFSARVGLIRTVIVDSRADDGFVQELKAKNKHGREVVAVVAPGEALDKLSQLIKTTTFDEVVVANSNLDETKLFELLDWAENNGKALAVVPSLMTVRATNVEMSTLAQTPIMFFKRTPLEGWGRIAKRVTDFILVTLALIILSPILLVAAILVKITSRGPVIYRQERIGQDGRPFFVHKFRSMYVDAEKRFNRDWSTDEKTDPRITPLGRFIRRTNVDELPQLWEVFIGKMSLVGPRPEQTKYVEKFAKEVPNYFKRHFVKSGLTGWAQINGLRGDTPIPERVKYDLYYIENWSLWFDLRIILATFAYLLRAHDN
ncbi:MAG TPA: sugar transferase [Candidatus Saccharimonadales bacterium]|nr:sugar transferase [Candidatus Saccharimonadales bacterium]